MRKNVSKIPSNVSRSSWTWKQKSSTLELIVSFSGISCDSLYPFSLHCPDNDTHTQIALLKHGASPTRDSADLNYRLFENYPFVAFFHLFSHVMLDNSATEEVKLLSEVVEALRYLQSQKSASAKFCSPLPVACALMDMIGKVKQSSNDYQELFQDSSNTGNVSGEFSKVLENHMFFVSFFVSRCIWSWRMCELRGNWRLTNPSTLEYKWSSRRGILPSLPSHSGHIRRRLRFQPYGDATRSCNVFRFLVLYWSAEYAVIGHSI